MTEIFIVELATGGWSGGSAYNYFTIFNNLAKVLDPEDMVLVAGPEFFRLRMGREEEEEKRGHLWAQQVPRHQGCVNGFFLFHEWLKDEDEEATDGQK